MEVVPTARRLAAFPARLASPSAIAGAVAPGLALGLLLSLAVTLDPGASPLAAQEPPAGEGGAPVAPADPAEPETGATKIPPIPEWTPSEPELLAQYTEARGHLDERRYDEARKAFKRLKPKAKGSAGEAAVDRCLREAEGGVLCEKAAEHAKKGQHRQVVRIWVEDGASLAGTFTGAELEKFHAEAFAEIFETLADFEPRTAAADPAAPAEGGGEGTGGGEGAPGGGRRGNTPYGANTKIVTGSPEAGEVKSGTGALYWLTSLQLAVIQIEIPEGVRLEDYRYLRLSVRTQEAGKESPLLLIFDCEAGDFGGQGGMGRRGAPWGIAAVHRRVGYHHSITAGPRYQDLRLDLRKFEAKGSPTWGNVLYLRFVSLGGAASSGFYFDDVLLEKE